MRKQQMVLAGLVVGALAVSACGSDAEVEVEGAWARTSPMGVTLGATYFDVTVAEDDRLIGASVSSDVAGRAEIHEVVESEMSDDAETSDEMDDMEMSAGSEDMDDTDDGDDMGGMMTMREVDGGLDLVGGETVSFEPGGYHVMLVDLVEPLQNGDEFEVTLDFETADDVTVSVQVADEAP